MTHLEHLIEVVPDLKARRVLDIGSGRGAFLRDCKKAGIDAWGVECSEEYLQKTEDLNVMKGYGENLPFADNSFDFVNLAQVLEHVQNPRKVVSEIHRILRPGGKAYMGVPIRYSFKDPHFHLYLVNWLPRSWTNGFISLFGKHKDYSIDNGRNRLAHANPHALPCEETYDMLPMHYYTYEQIQRELDKFEVEDIRLRKVGPLKPVYPILRDYFLDSFHLLATKV